MALRRAAGEGRREELKPMDDRLPDHAFRKLLALAAAGDGEDRGPGDVPPRYAIVRELGRGGMGVVFEAFDRRLGRHCALKAMHATGAAGDELRRRFAREAQAAARLSHPHVAAIYDATPDYIAMQLVAGVPIDSVDRCDRRLVVELMRDAARAVHYAHEQGIVHRDLKPSNLLVEERHVFVVDFGLAKDLTLGASHSLTGAIVGTPAFMPPEQARGLSDAIDARSDVYALGATLYACLSGRPPFEDPVLPELLRRIAEDEPRSPAVDRDLDLVILKCLEKDPARRYPTAAALADDLERWLEGVPVRARRPSPGYRLRKLLERKKLLLKAAGLAALAAGVATALVLVPIALRESAAREAADGALDLSVRSAAILRDAAVFSRLGDVVSARQVLDEGIASTRVFLDRHEVPRGRYLLSRLLRARGHADLALAELERAISEEPGFAEARFERGLAIAARAAPSDAERARAIADLECALVASSALTGVERLHARGVLHYLSGELNEAMALQNEVLAYDVTHVAARAALAKVALALGEDDLARHYVVSAVDMQQGFGPVYVARERRLLPAAILGLDAALVDFGRELADEPDNAMLLAHRGLVHLRRALRLDAENARDVAVAAVQSAIEDHDATLLIHSELAGAFNNRAVCWMQAERLFAAGGDAAAAADARVHVESDLAAAVAHDPRLPEAPFNAAIFALRSVDLYRKLGRAAAAARRIDAACAALQRALELAPADWAHLRACRAKLAQAEAMRDGGG